MSRTIRGMWKSRWVRRVLLAVVWAYAALTWSSIGHHLFGLPDLGAVVAIGIVAVILLWHQGARRMDAKFTSVTFPAAIKHSR